MASRFDKPFDWTPEAVQRLREMFDAGLSYAVIAQRMGHGLTRNACLGKAHRLGFASRGAPSKPTVTLRPAPKAPPVKRDARPDAAIKMRINSKREEAAKATKKATPRRLGIAGNGTVYEQAPAAEPRAFTPRTTTATGEPCTIEHVVGCRWPIGEAPFGRMETLLFCNGGRDEGATYCSRHKPLATSKLGNPLGKSDRTPNELMRSLRRHVA